MLARRIVAKHVVKTTVLAMLGTRWSCHFYRFYLPI